MPLSSTANFSCDVNKNGGNNSSVVGPFNDIQTAINYITFNFAPSPSQHAVIYLGPGIYSDAADLINISSNGLTRYIDFVGIGKQDTILQVSGSTAAVIISVSGAENHFRDLTIQNTSTALGNYAVDVSAATNVIFDNCRILGAAACINNLAQNATMNNCEIVSTSTNAETIVSTLSGLMNNCNFTATSMVLGGTFIGTLAGVLQYSSLFASNTTVDIRAVNSLSGRASFCYMETGGYTIVNLTGVLEHSTAISYAANGGHVIDSMSSAVVKHCFLQQNGNQAVIANVSVGASSVFHTTHYAPSSSSSIVSSVQVDGCTWISCSFYNNGTGGFALAANAAGRLLNLGDITANELVDPQFSVTYDFERGRHNVTAVKTAAYTANINDTVRCNPTGGAFTVTLPAITTGNSGMQITIKNQSGSANVITIATSGANTVDGAATTTIAAARGKVNVESDGVGDWMIVG